MGDFVLPDVAETIAQDGDRDGALGKNHGYRDGHCAPEAVVDLAAFEHEFQFLAAPIRKKFLAKLVPEKR